MLLKKEQSILQEEDNKELKKSFSKTENDFFGWTKNSADWTN